MTPQYNMDEHGFIQLLKQHIAFWGSQRAFAREIGVSGQYLNDVVHGRREPGKKLVDAMNLSRHVVYLVKP